MAARSATRCGVGRSAATAAYERQEPLSQPRLNGAERPIPLGPMISCPIEVKGRTVGAVAVAFDAEPDAAAARGRRQRHARSGRLRGVLCGRALHRGKRRHASTASTGFAPNDMTRTQPGPFAAALRRTRRARSRTDAGGACLRPRCRPVRSRRRPTSHVAQRSRPTRSSCRRRTLHESCSCWPRWRRTNASQAAATAFATELATAVRL